MQCVILHGAFGSKDGNWFPWLKNELETLGNEVFLEQYPVDDWDDIEKRGCNNSQTKQNLISWIQFFETNTLPQLDRKEDIVFIGHSLSPVFILHLIDKFNLKCKGAVFVSPFLKALVDEKTWHFDVVNRTFFKTDFNWNKLKKLIGKSFVLYGTHDPYVPSRLPIQFASHLGSEIITVENGGHLGGEYQSFPLILKLFHKLS